ncbi:baseplate J/gp47 family protein [Paenibacillus sp. NPDC057967]|uniref:baseplate J/gp47 family protein n=1 Tax=Paenibacillus sp. NPDC057967 TaxID=3346293 RepID=UPI0036DE7083
MTIPLPEYLTDQTLEAIHARMLTSMPDNLDKAEGSMPWDTTIPAAIELTLAADWAQEVLRRGFAQHTFGEYLDLRTEEHGVIRKEAVHASEKVLLRGKYGTNVPSGWQLSTIGDAPIYFELVNAVMVGADGEVEAAIRAMEAGALGNVAAGTIVNIVESIEGLTSVTNLRPTSGGADRESDAALLDRYLKKVRTPSAGGNKNDYINWALEVPGVSDVQILPLWDGPGTVKVIILGADKQPASPDLVYSVQNFISPDPALGNGMAPIGALVTVSAAKAIMINVSAEVQLAEDTNLQTVKSMFSSVLLNYIKSLAFSSDPSVKYVRIGSILLDTPGVQDYSGLTVNGITDNIPVGLGEVAVLGTVTLV